MGESTPDTTCYYFQFNFLPSIVERNSLSVRERRERRDGGSSSYTASSRPSAARTIDFGTADTGWQPSLSEVMQYAEL